VGPSNGTLVLNANGSFTYTPNANFAATDTFTYRSNDGSANSNIATVTITVSAVNHAPVAANDAYSTNEDTPLTISASGVLGNDSDQDGDTLTAILNSGPTHGTLSLNANGGFTYTPNANYNGSDSFTYHARDASLDSNVATVTLTITPVNDAPVAQNDPYSINEDTVLTVPVPGVLSNDTDVDGNPLTAVLNSGPIHGTLSLNANGSFTYTPAANYNGSDSFTYHASDGSLNSNVATVTITITPVNDPPVAASDAYSTSMNTPLTVAAPGVLANDTDADGNPLTAVLNVGPSNGALVLNANGSFTYTPNANYNGSDSFTYHARDASLDSNIATVTITVQPPVNQAPVVNAGTDQVIVYPRNLVLTGKVTDDGLPNPPALTYAWSKVSGPGTVTFTPISGSATSGVPFTSTVTFSRTGSYTLRLTGKDGVLSSSDDVVVSVRKK
jgi:VCBS repeat-containing protein